MAYAHIGPALAEKALQRVRRRRQATPPHLPGKPLGKRVPACAVAGGQARRHQIPGAGEQATERLPLRFPRLQGRAEGGKLRRLAAAQQLAEGTRTVIRARTLLRRGQLPLHRPGADGGQQGRAVGRAEEEGGVGRAILHHLQQHILCLCLQQGAVREHVDLAPALVGQSVGVGNHIPQHIHGDIFVVRVRHGHDIRMDPPHHLPAGEAHPAGAALANALHGRGGKPGRGRQIPLPAEDQGVAQGVPPSRLPQALRQQGLPWYRQLFSHRPFPLPPPAAQEACGRMQNHHHFITNSG